MKIDDPLDAVPVHAMCGFYGLLMPGFFAKTEFMQEYAPDFTLSVSSRTYSGVFYNGDGSLLLAQVIEGLCIIAWVSVFIGPYFFFLKKMGWFRVGIDTEELGLDVSCHAGTAYPELYDENTAPNQIKPDANVENIKSAIGSI